MLVHFRIVNFFFNDIFKMLNVLFVALVEPRNTLFIDFKRIFIFLRVHLQPNLIHHILLKFVHFETHLLVFINQFLNLVIFKLSFVMEMFLLFFELFLDSLRLFLNISLKLIILLLEYFLSCILCVDFKSQFQNFSF